MLAEIRQQAEKIVTQLIEIAHPAPKDILVVGCSTSEVCGELIGSASNLEVAQAIFEGILPQLQKRKIFLAAQCCEHLNRAVILEREAVEYYRLEQVNVVPVPKAGGSFATTAYARFKEPIAVEKIRASCGIDIGGTLIGMHLKEVAVPVHLKDPWIGKAQVNCARTRPKFIGGSRAQYDEKLQ